MKYGIAINEIILLLKQILPVRTVRNTYTPVGRICVSHQDRTKTYQLQLFVLLSIVYFPLKELQCQSFLRPFISCRKSPKCDQQSPLRNPQLAKPKIRNFLRRFSFRLENQFMHGKFENSKTSKFSCCVCRDWHDISGVRIHTWDNLQW